jgi:hypothetical protein
LDQTYLLVNTASLDYHYDNTATLYGGGGYLSISLESLDDSEGKYSEVPQIRNILASLLKGGLTLLPNY